MSSMHDTSGDLTGGPGSQGQEAAVPAIIVDLTGEIVSLNEIARQRFPSLPDLGIDHPLLQRSPEWLGRVKEEGVVRETVHADGRPYEVHMSFDAGQGQVVFQVHDT